MKCMGCYSRFGLSCAKLNMNIEDAEKKCNTVNTKPTDPFTVFAMAICSNAVRVHNQSKDKLWIK